MERKLIFESGSRQGMLREIQELAKIEISHIEWLLKRDWPEQKIGELEGKKYVYESLLEMEILEKRS